VDSDVRRELERLARANDRSLSAEIRRALNQYLEDEKEDTWASTASTGRPPTGKRLVPEGPARPKNWWADVPGLRDADEDSITVARRWFSEASFDHFEIER
jgi:hypothetical protein